MILYYKILAKKEIGLSSFISVIFQLVKYNGKPEEYKIFLFFSEQFGPFLLWFSYMKFS